MIIRISFINILHHTFTVTIFCVCRFLRFLYMQIFKILTAFKYMMQYY